MQSLYELTKKIDALTANSMQVLNALVRSCIAGGSSRGYSVSKYGVTIEMSRADIYRLYDFYQDWERHGFTVDGFDALLEKANQRWVNSRQGANGDADSTLATDAVVKHSQILYLDSTNSKNTSPDFWVNKIKETAENSTEVAKAAVSSAPIPLNLRTPLYDENLSVKSFTQYETYLFPIGYQRSLLLGVPGNGESYLAGGKNWTIEVTDYLSLRGKHTVFGSVSNPQNRVDNYFYVDGKWAIGDESRNTISGGYESYALRDNSGAFGHQSIAMGKNAFAFGYASRAYGESSFIAGGQNCVTLGVTSFSTGINGLTVNDTAFTANRGTMTTPAAYRFNIEAIDNSQDVATTDCTAIFDESRSECIVPDSAAAVASLSAAYTIVITKEAVISAGDVNKEGNAELGIQVGDQVMVYDHRRLSGGTYIETQAYAGYTFPTMMTTVKTISEEKERYLVTLGRPVQLSMTINGNTYGTTVSGRIAVVARYVAARNADGIYSNPAQVSIGTDCTAFGYATRATGLAQTVVGSMNAENYYARFVVGCGSAYIDAGTLHEGVDENTPRTNGMVVSPFYSYMREINGLGTVGVGSNGYYGDDADHVQIFRGGFMTGDDGKGLNTVVNARPEKVTAYARAETESHGMLLLGTTEKPVVDNSWPATAHLLARHGMTIVSAGAYISANTPLVETLLEESRVLEQTEEDGVGVYSKGGIEIRSIGKKGMHIGASAYISMTFAGLTMSGETYRTLTASCKSRDHMLGYDETAVKSNRSGLETLSGLCHSGFYYGWMNEANYSFNTDEQGAFKPWHVISSTAELDSADFDMAALLLPAQIPSGTKPHPRVVQYVNDGTYRSNGQLHLNEELAYLSDDMFSSGTMALTTAGKMVTMNAYAENYTTTAEGAWSQETGTPSIVKATLTATTDDSRFFQEASAAIRRMSYALNGNQLTVSACVEVKLTSSISTALRYTIALPIVLGMNTVPLNDNRFPSMVNITRWLTFSRNTAGVIPVTVQNVDGDVGNNMSGMAVVNTDGQIRLVLRNDNAENDTLETYYISFTGVVPFYAASDSRGMNVDPSVRT